MKVIRKSKLKLAQTKELVLPSTSLSGFPPLLHGQISSVVERQRSSTDGPPFLRVVTVNKTKKISSTFRSKYTL